MKAANVVTDEDFNWGQILILTWDGPNKGACVIATCYISRKKNSRVGNSYISWVKGIAIETDNL